MAVRPDKMKILFSLGFCLLFVVFAKGETCTTMSDCTGTSCSPGYTVVCQHPPGSGGIVADGGICTCGSMLECKVRDDCLTANLPCTEQYRHCYDNKCICSRLEPY